MVQPACLFVFFLTWRKTNDWYVSVLYCWEGTLHSEVTVSLSFTHDVCIHKLLLIFCQQISVFEKKFSTLFFSRALYHVCMWDRELLYMKNIFTLYMYLSLPLSPSSSQDLYLWLPLFSRLNLSLFLPLYFLIPLLLCLFMSISSYFSPILLVFLLRFLFFSLYLSITHRLVFWCMSCPILPLVTLPTRFPSLHLSFRLKFALFSNKPDLLHSNWRLHTWISATQYNKNTALSFLLLRIFWNKI